MRTKKTLSTDIKAKLDHLSQESKSTYLSLFLQSDDAGMITNSHNQNLFELCQNNLIQVTKDHIVLNAYLGSNYGKTLNPEYSPTKSVFQIIKDAGFTYNASSNEIEIPKTLLLSQNESLNGATNVQMSTNVSKRLEPSPQVTILSQSPIIQFIGSIRFALYLSIGLMIGQSVHTTFTLHSLSHIPNPYNTMSAIFTALLLDFMMLYFVINGKSSQSMFFFMFCSLMNIYSFHINTDYLTYQSYFAILVSIAIPFAVHQVSGMVQEKTKVFS